MPVYHCKSRETRGCFCVKITICYCNLKKNRDTSETIDLCSVAFTLLNRCCFFFFPEENINLVFKNMENEGVCSFESPSQVDTYSQTPILLS